LKLLIDIGNSRIKWVMRGGDGGQGSEMRSLRYQKRRPQEAFFSAWARERRPEAVYAANVGGAGVGRALERWTRRQWNLAPQYPQVSDRLGGIRNGYRRKELLGIDRWLAMAGAWARYRQPLCLIDCGTAITVDVLDREGNHAGGVILPGKRLLCEALARGTAQLRNPRFSGPDRTLRLGRDTDEAVRFGNGYMIAGALRYIVAEVRARYGEDVRILFDGGDAAELAALVGEGSTHDPGLVLEGLAYFAGLGQ